MIFIRTGSIDLHYLHTLPRSIYTQDEKCLHTLPRSYLGVVVTEEEEASVHSRVAMMEEEQQEEAGMRTCCRAAAAAEETDLSSGDDGAGDWRSRERQGLREFCNEKRNATRRATIYRFGTISNGS
jgi:hypothetical protein